MPPNLNGGVERTRKYHYDTDTFNLAGFFVSAEQENAFGPPDEMGNDDIIIEWPDLDVGGLERALRGLRLGAAPLWATDLPEFMESPEMKEAIRVHESLLFSAVEQWSYARKRGDRTVALRLAVPKTVARPWIALARRLCDAMSDAEPMTAAGLEPVTARDATFARRMLERAERQILRCHHDR